MNSHPMSILQLVDQLIQSGGAIVSSAACSPMEIAFAQTHGQFAVNDDGFGFVLRSKDWLDLQKTRELAHPNTDGQYSSS